MRSQQTWGSFIKMAPIIDQDVVIVRQYANKKVFYNIQCEVALAACECSEISGEGLPGDRRAFFNNNSYIL